MRQIAALSGRELRSYFWSPVGYVCAALLLFAMAWVFIGAFEQGNAASMRPVFGLGALLLLIVCPAISMGAISEERQTGTFELLMTSPISLWQLVVSKYLAMLVFVAALLSPTLVHIGLLELYGRPDYGELASGYLGLLLAAAAYLSTGLFASSLTRSQLVAFLCTAVFWLALIAGGFELSTRLPEPWASLAYSANPWPRVYDFAIGLIDTAHVVYFVSIAAAFLMGATLVLEARRWP